TVDDVPTVLPPAIIAVAEAIAVDDLPTVLPPAIIAVAEAIAVDDLPTVLPPAIIAVAEAILVDDLPAVLTPAVIDLPEAVSGDDVPTVSPPTAITVEEAISVSDASDVVTSTPPCPPDLFFSEYVEGSGNNKALEIFNGTPFTVDLTGYVVEIHSGSHAVTISLHGAVASGDVFVLVNASPSPA